ncbi:hypothetical protein GCM10027073_45760 [Streptomyces chlorus]
MTDMEEQRGRGGGPPRRRRPGPPGWWRYGPSGRGRWAGEGDGTDGDGARNRRSRWPWPSTLLLTAFVLIGSAFAEHSQEGERVALDPFTRLLLFAAGAVLPWRQRHPVPVVFAAVAAVLLYLGAGYPYGPVFLTLLQCRRHRPPPGGVGGDGNTLGRAPAARASAPPAAAAGRRRGCLLERGDRPPSGRQPPLTAKTHVSRTMVKLGARDRAQLVLPAYESGLVRPGWLG